VFRHAKDRDLLKPFPVDDPSLGVPHPCSGNEHIRQRVGMPLASFSRVVSNLVLLRSIEPCCAPLASPCLPKALLVRDAPQVLYKHDGSGRSSNIVSGTASKTSVIVRTSTIVSGEVWNVPQTLGDSSNKNP
jgi:hypothetical protein